MGLVSQLKKHSTSLSRDFNTQSCELLAKTAQQDIAAFLSISKDVAYTKHAGKPALPHSLFEVARQSETLKYMSTNESQKPAKVDDVMSWFRW